MSVTTAGKVLIAQFLTASTGAPTENVSLRTSASARLATPVILAPKLPFARRVAITMATVNEVLVSASVPLGGFLRTAAIQSALKIAQVMETASDLVFAPARRDGLAKVVMLLTAENPAFTVSAKTTETIPDASVLLDGEGSCAMSLAARSVILTRASVFPPECANASSVGPERLVAFHDVTTNTVATPLTGSA